MLKTFERRPRLVASTIVTALLLAVSAISPFSGTTALAVPLGSNDIVLGACNNTFQPIKFPLEYDIVARPSANPDRAAVGEQNDTENRREKRRPECPKSCEEK